MKKRYYLVIAVLLVMLAGTTCFADGVTIHRDNYGVPHIYADSIEGLYYGWGYASAQDRLFQLEMLKRTYYGQVSELFGDTYASLDQYFMTEYPTADELMESYGKLDKKYQTIITSYAKGINAWIDEVLKDLDNKLPYEFHELGIVPQYWNEADAAAAIMATLGIFMDLTNEMIHIDLYTYLKSRYGDRADSFFDDMAWIDDPSAYTTIQDDDQNGPVKSKTPVANAVNRKPLPTSTPLYNSKEQMVSLMLSATGIEVPTKILRDAMEAASYCVVVGPEKSETGNALLMAGPQVDWWVPGLVYEVGLHGAGFDVLGTALFGAPYIMFGATSTTAFSCTAGADNIVDIYEEQLNPENPRQYMFNGKWVDMEVRVEEIKIKGKEPRVVELLRTVHGPVIMQVDVDEDGKYDIAYSKKTACFDSYLSAVAAYTELMLAKTPKEFLKSGELLDPVLNFFWADNQGNIGYYHCGKIPVRPEGIDTRLPTPGTGEYEWEGFLKAKDHPQIINPEYGYIVNWNNKPIDGFDNGDLGAVMTWGGWSIDHRANNLDRVLREATPVSPDDLKEIIHSVADAQLEAVAMKGFLLDALEDEFDPGLIIARNHLAEWDNLRSDKDNDGYYDSVGLVIFQAWWPIVVEKTFKDEFGYFWNSWYNYGGLLDNYAGYSFFVRTILGDQAAVPLKNDYYNGEDWKEVFIESLRLALDSLDAEYGTSDYTHWKKPIKMMPFPSTHIMGAPTSFATLPKVKYMDRGSQNHVVDLSSPVIKGWNVCPPGQSGFISKDGVRDKHFSDQYAMYANWEYKDMLIEKGDVLTNLESTTILHYEPSKK